MSRPSTRGLLTPGAALRRRLAAVAVALLAGAAAAAQEPAAIELPPRLVTVEIDGNGASLGPDDLLVVDAGSARPPLEVRPARDWQVVVLAALPLLEPPSLRSGAAALSRVAAELVALGEVEVVLSDGGPEALVEPTRREAELRTSFEELGLEADGAGELFELREAFRDELAELRGEPPARLAGLALDFLEEELELVAGERDTLLTWLTETDVRRPRLLLLLADLAATDPLAFYSKSLPAAAATELERLAAELDPGVELGPVLAACGFTVFPLALGAPPPGILDQLAELAEASGGRLIDSEQTLAKGVAELGRRLALRYRPTFIESGLPHPFEIRARSAEIELRGPEWATATTPEAVAEARARRLLEGAEDRGDLPLRAVYRTELATAEGGGTGVVELAHLEAVVDLPFSHPTLTSAPLRTTLYLDRLDAPPIAVHRFGAGSDLADAEAWLLRSSFPIPDDLDEIAVVIEEIGSGRWGGSFAELVETPLRAAGAGIVSEAIDFLPSQPQGETAPGDTTAAGRSTLIRVLPPARTPATGRQRFRVLVTNVAVDAVAFYLDDEKIEEDGRPPFGVTLDLGAEPTPRTVRVVALDRRGVELGEDEIRINDPDRPFAVTITALTPKAGTVEVAAEVSVPREAALDRVEVYLNDTRIVELEETSIAAALPRPRPQPGDYVSVVALLADGSRAEDVRLLDAPGQVETIEVNLIELFAVVSDRDGQPVEDLTADDFTIELGGEERPVQRFAYADEVPLVLGLVIDTSLSMWPLMPETKTAAIRFLGDTLTDIDRAFVVDFSDQPRLAQGTTGDLFTLVRSIGRLEADGATALYDAVVFSLLQFDDSEGRQALVLLTDGDDYQSRFGYRRVYQTVASGGLPIYFLALAGMAEGRPSYRKSDLEGLAAASGGRVFYIKSGDELGAAYTVIESELRNQYLLAFATDRDLTEKELGQIRVKVRQRGHEVRFVVGRR